MDSLIATDDHW